MDWAIASIFGLSLLAGIIGGSKHPRILPGSHFQLEFFPHQVSIRLFDVHICGGSIISEKHILTHAQCVGNSNTIKDFFKIHSGARISNERGNVHEVLSAHFRSKRLFDEKEGIPNDIAVITLKHPMVFDKYQNKINLPNHDPQDFERAYLIGWGRTKNLRQNMSEELQETPVKLMRRDKCKHLSTEKMKLKQICAFRILENGKCKGNTAGDALVSDDQILGIASYSDEKNCTDEKFGVYTNVFQYKDFIESVMKE